VQAVVLAGGKGTRLSGSPEAPPKVLAPLAGLPTIDLVLGWLAREGVTDVLLCLGHRAAEIRQAVGSGARFGIRVTACTESVPLGTAGAVKNCETGLEERFFVVYGDVVADVDLHRMLQFHLSRKAVATLAVHPSDHLYDSDRVVPDSEGRIHLLFPKDAPVGPEAGSLASAALYVVERSLLTRISSGTPTDFARDVFPKLVLAGEPLFAYRTTEYIRDMGTPERRERVERDLLGGVPASMRLSSFRPAVLTDRDGVLIRDATRITTASQIEVLPGVALALRKLNREGVLAVCCTNQPVIAWGGLSLEGLHDLHTLLEGKLGEAGAWLDGFYTCPHHPDRGFEGERIELKVPCRCRKPLPGMLLDAVSDLGIDRRSSVFVGDRTVDLGAARSAGVLGIGVLTGTALRDGKRPIPPETPIVPTFADAVSFFLETAPSWKPLLDEIEATRMVLIGGSSRSGKTLAAAALGLALRGRGVPCLHISLDRFILPLRDRRPNASLAERTGFEAARLAVARLALHEPTLVPSYDARRREAGPSEIMAWTSGVLIVEGLYAPMLHSDPAVRIELWAPKEALEQRRRAFYSWKGLSDEELERVLQERHREDAELTAMPIGPRRSFHLDERGRLAAA
jgi:histidinol-phosphate phosphatase family protein